MKKISAALSIGVLYAAAVSAFAAGDFAPQLDFPLHKEIAAMPAAQVKEIIGPSGLGFSAQSPNVVLDQEENFMALPNCGGRMQIFHRDGQAYLSFVGVAKCSNFEVLASDLKELPKNYTHMSRRLDTLGPTFEGGFPIPSEYLEHVQCGWGGVVISIQSDSKTTRDLISVRL